ncbi:MAG: short-chain dehydrogenase [Chromatiales bacterium]|nr:short-chain dehydrogenase [Chromatiales bacterium]MDP6151232.1 SDR family oxidoreductase [Gammaproteobacteria bacterium]MDP7092967.1 SDR family oxidoreductase [Gammaproteobacteria bacterium]MDP7270204.1 SDR family oxidoreductase [Gammaproteobacteria bacterium]HJP04279.1 SDR family oxidoreductase [Gammaproteobacteria bacterium]
MPTILITGANRGLGLEFARQYSADGWKVIACCRTPADAHELNELAAGADITVEQLDVNDFAAIDALGEKYKGVPIDVLLNNAGIIGPIPIAENAMRQHFSKMDYEVWEQVLRTNTFAPVKMAEVFLENVAASEQKKIVTISSTVGSIAEMSVPALAYASSKTALNRVMTIIAGQLKERGIIVAMYCPGYVKTRMDAFGYATVEVPESIAALRPMIADLTIEKTGSFTGHDGRTIGW